MAIKKAAPVKRKASAPKPKPKATKPTQKQKQRAKSKAQAKPFNPPKLEAEEPPRLPSTLEILKAKTPLVEPSEELTAAVSYLVRQGNHAEVACRAMGIPRFAVRRWIERGLAELEDQASPFARFVLAVDAADAQDEVMDLQQISLGYKHWPALAWKRERKTAQRWGAKGTPASEFDALEKREAPAYSLDEAAMVMAILERHQPPVEATVLEAEAVPATPVNGNGAGH